MKSAEIRSPPERPSALFFRFGGFSHINASLIAELRLALPELDIEDIDLAALRPNSRIARWERKLSRLWNYGPRKLTGRPVPADAELKTPAAFAQLSRLARRVQRLYRGRCVVSLQTQALFNAKAPGVPHLVYTDHAHLANLGYPDFDPRQLAAKGWIARERSVFAADAVLVMSEHVRRCLNRVYGVADARLHKVGVGANAAPALRAGKEGRGRSVLFVGVDWERKGGPELVRAVELARSRFPDLELTIVGCRPPGLPPFCTVVGQVPLEQVQGYMADADIFCLPTKIEPFGIVAVEAMAAGTPVVAPRLGAFPDFIRDGEDGFLYAPGDFQALADALMRALALGDDLRRVGDRARAAVALRYTWPAVAERIAALMRGLAAF